jgi:hypothetical protein
VVQNERGIEKAVFKARGEDDEVTDQIIPRSSTVSQLHVWKNSGSDDKAGKSAPK